RPHFRAGLSCIREIGDDRIGERASWTADVAPAVVDAGWSPPVVGRVHPHRCRHHADADRFETFEPDLAVTEGLHRRHRIRLAHRPPALLPPGIRPDA